MKRATKETAAGRRSARFGQLSRIWVAKSMPGFGIWPAIVNIGGQIVAPATELDRVPGDDAEPTDGDCYSAVRLRSNAFAGHGIIPNAGTDYRGRHQKTRLTRCSKAASEETSVEVPGFGEIS